MMGMPLVDVFVGRYFSTEGELNLEDNDDYTKFYASFELT